jgi:hypothetical protein
MKQLQLDEEGKKIKRKQEEKFQNRKYFNGLENE